MKESYYFSHDTNSRNDPKILALRSKYDYGNFWIVVEMLRESEDYKIPCKKYIWSAIAQQLSTASRSFTSQEAENFINDCINEFELFKTDGEYFWSESLLKRMEKREEKSRRNSENGKKGAAKKWQGHSEAIATPENIDSPPIAIDSKESKGKEKKEKEIESKINEIKETEKNVEEVAVVTAVPEEESIFPLFMATYDEFVQKRTGGPAKIDGAQGNAAKAIIEYLKRRSKSKNSEGALAGWEWVLSHWDKLEPYQRSKIKLTEINSDIIKIFDQINNPSTNGKTVKKPLASTVRVTQNTKFGSL